MKPIVCTILVLVPFCCFSQYTYDHLQVNFLASPAAAKTCTYENLRLYPVYAKPSFRATFKSVGKYTSLDDALQKKKVKITEKGPGGTVNTLTIENVSSDTIIIICGDVVKGGQQDRIIEKDMVLRPRSGKQDLSVFCVESGRWSPRADAISSGPNRSREVTLTAAPEFKEHYHKGSMGLRKVVEKEKDQSKVWSKVEEVNLNNKTLTATKTYTALTSSDAFSKKLNAYLQFFQGRLAAEPGVIGVVVVTGNRVLGCDLFATPDLFKSQFPSLLHSYATEAILNGKPVTATTPVVKAYTDRLLKDEATQKATLKQKGTAFVDKGKKLRVSSFD